MSISAKTGGRARARKGKQQPSASYGHDALILVSFAAALFVVLAVFWPQFSEPAGPAVHDALRLVLGVGMYAMPFAVLFTPLALLQCEAQQQLLRAALWSWSMVLIFALTGGLWPERSWGGLLGDSVAQLGFAYLGGFYPFVIALFSLLVVIRLAGRSLLLPVAQHAYQAAAGATAAAADFAGTVAEHADERALRRSERRIERDKRRAELSEAQRLRQEEILAAALEAADAPENDSPLIGLREQSLEVIEPAALAAAETRERVKTAGAAPAVVRPLGTARVHQASAAEVEDVEEEEEYLDEDDEFAAVLERAVGAADSGDGEEDEEEYEEEEYDEEAEYDEDEDVEEDAEVAEEVAASAPARRVVQRSESRNARSGDGRELLAAQALKAQSVREGQLGLFASTQAGYSLPPLDILRSAPVVAGEEQHIEKRSRIIEKTLASFNIEAKCVNAVIGPRVTRYEIRIGPGINVSKIHGLADNLALELAVKAVRIEAPIPGKSAVGIEVPNSSPQLVTLRSVLESPVYQSANHPLTVGLGRDIAGHPVIANLAKMPHLLVAGATGSGKSVCLNALIVSLLMRNAPDTLRLILIDPKRVELTCYENAPQLACPIVNEVAKAQNALKWVVAEMDRRYRLLEQSRARNIAAYNEMSSPEERLPFIVVVVDELADLMMLAGQTIEKLVCRIAQLSRAVGIHLIIATQRPDVKVITGTIKANIPSRIAFAVVSHVDSRTILDGGGADKLLGSGDMLFAPIGENKPMRVQGAYLSDEEIDKVVEWCREQAGAYYDESILNFGNGEGTSLADPYGLGADDSSRGDGRDELFDEAVEIVTNSGRASISYLQRRLKIGYNRAARLMEELEQEGIVSEPDHQGNRKVM